MIEGLLEAIEIKIDMDFLRIVRSITDKIVFIRKIDKSTDTVMVSRNTERYVFEEEICYMFSC